MLTSYWEFVKQNKNLKKVIKVKNIFGLKKSYWWCKEKKDAEGCPVPL